MGFADIGLDGVYVGKKPIEALHGLRVFGLRRNLRRHELPSWRGCLHPRAMYHTVSCVTACSSCMSLPVVPCVYVLCAIKT